MNLRFIIDENITPDAVAIFRDAGLKAWHINEFKSNNKQRVVDDQLRRLSIQKGYIIVTKDDDFVKSFVDRKVPEKMIYIFNLTNKESLLSRLDDSVSKLPYLLMSHDFIEINDTTIRFPFTD